METMKNPILKVNKVTKNYQEKSVLKPLSFSIYSGETVAIIGPSGAGKTTLLNLLSNTINPDEGSIWYEDTPYETIKNRKLFAQKIGIIRQQYDLIQELSVLQNVLIGRLNQWSFGKSLLSLFIPQDKNKALEVLTTVGLNQAINQKAKTLSGGEQQRVALARLLLQNPNIILADEPVSSLDPTRAEEALIQLTTLAKENNKTLITVLHSTHYAKKYYNRIIGLKNGIIQFDLSSSEVDEDVLESLYTTKELDYDKV